MKYSEQILFTVVFGVTLYYAVQHTDHSETNYKMGLIGACFVFVAEGTLRNYKGPFLRPNEAFWRGVLRFCLIYMGILVFLSFQNGTDARNLFKHLYPELGQPVPHHMHTYDDNCDFEWINLWDNLDHYFAIHLINWFCAALIVRDPYILHTWSVLDEIIELSAQHVLPHFRECWWDHVLLDVLMSNTTAIIVGLFVVKLLGIQEYDWLGRKGAKNFTEWKVWSCHRHFGGMIAIWVIIIINFLCGFFMINSLWIPPKNWINIYRLSVWFLLSNLAFKEAYTDISTWGTKTRVENPISGKCRWVTFFICFTEVFISAKFSHDAGNMLDEPTPLYVSIPWIAVSTFCAIYYLYLRFKPDHTLKYPAEYYKKLEQRQQAKANKAQAHNAQKVQQIAAAEPSKIAASNNKGENKAAQPKSNKKKQ